MLHRDLYTHLPALDEFARRDLPTKLAFRVSLKLKALRAYFEELEIKRIALLRQFAVLDERGEPVQAEQGRTKLRDPEGFAKEWRELLDAEAEVVLGKPLTLAELPEDLKLPANEMVSIIALNLLLYEEE